MATQRLRGERVTLRPLEPADAPRLAEIAAEPEVARWWRGLNEALLELARPGEEMLAFTVELDGETIGLAQAGEETDPDYRHASVDLFLATAHHGQGLGADTLRTLARWLFADRGHHRITIDPAAANERAVRSYERIGFKRVGVLRRTSAAPRAPGTTGSCSTCFPRTWTPRCRTRAGWFW